MRPTMCALLAALLGVFSAQAQTAPDEALAHLRQHRAELGLTEADVADVAVTDEVVTRRGAMTHVYLRQRHAGIEILGAEMTVTLGPDGAVIHAAGRFVPDAAALAEASAPELAPEKAVEAAARALELPLASAVEPVAVAKGKALEGATYFGGAELSQDAIPARLVYVYTEDGRLRLAWDLVIRPFEGADWWNVQVDAATGRLVGRHNWTIHDDFGAPEAPATSLLEASPAAAKGAVSGGYRVYAVPLESPIHGARTFVQNPADPVASPHGWHATREESYTTTRGNNVIAYEDRNRRNNPSIGYSPDGGADLVFDFDLDFNATPESNQDAVIVNQFYWSNILHDVLYRYGFDEAAGNFQEDNFDRGGDEGDPVRSEAQDGSGTNNANFSTPPDGGAARMQMFTWDAPIQAAFSSGGQEVGDFVAAGAEFGAKVTFEGLEGKLVVTADSAGSSLACTGLVNSDEVAGHVALIDRGTCFFVDKVGHAQEAGAVGVVIVNSNPGEGPIRQGAGEDDALNLRIPSIMISKEAGDVVKGALPNVDVFLRTLFQDRDSGFDNGIVAHEYAHGLSTRLTGGPANSNCLSYNAENDTGTREQPGEGWSDFVGLIFTMRDGDFGDMPRGIGTYVTYEETDGIGIRPAPYSINTTVNPLTYEDRTRVSIPHGVGTLFASALWDMTWLLVDHYGFDPDLYEGTGGNNIALQLVVDGMKMQPCNPGFIDARDAILAADRASNRSAHQCAIWTAFAGRGIGYSAQQGSSRSITDGLAAFDMPPAETLDCTAGLVDVDEERSERPRLRLEEAHPNPTSHAARFALTIRTSQSVRVTLYDALGREVAVLHDGFLAGGTPHRFTIDAAALASGLYLYRVEGDTFSETRRVMVVR